ncbi:hypothetical protein Tco_0856013 [Tanacetum coccineum]
MVDGDKPPEPKKKGVDGLEGTENYKIWSVAVQLALHTINKLGFINWKCVKNKNDDMLEEQWNRCNSVMLSWILGCISQDLYRGQIYYKIAKTVWDKLKETYDKQDSYMIYNLHYKIQLFTQARSPLSEYYHTFNALWREFDILVNLPGCSCDGAPTLKKHNDLLKLMQFLMGLDDVTTVT